MAEYIRKEAAVDAGYLSDWYISSVGDEPPVWTDAHIDELLNDFIVIPKDTPTADVQPVKRGRWIITDDVEHFIAICSECGRTVDSRGIKDMPYCHCGARMDGDTNE